MIVSIQSFNINNIDQKVFYDGTDYYILITDIETSLTQLPLLDENGNQVMNEAEENKLIPAFYFEENKSYKPRLEKITVDEAILTSLVNDHEEVVNLENYMSYN